MQTSNTLGVLWNSAKVNTVMLLKCQILYFQWHHEHSLKRKQGQQ
jgi:hypothetical protein